MEVPRLRNVRSRATTAAAVRVRLGVHLDDGYEAELRQERLYVGAAKRHVPDHGLSTRSVLPCETEQVHADPGFVPTRMIDSKDEPALRTAGVHVGELDPVLAILRLARISTLVVPGRIEIHAGGRLFILPFLLVLDSGL